jgi:Fic family protein
VKRNTLGPGRPSREAVFERLAVAVTEMRALLGGLPEPDDANAIWQGIWVHEAHHSTALEGNTLVLEEVETLLGEGRVTGGKELAQYLEVSGYASAAKWVYAQAATADEWVGGGALTLTEVRHVHELALGPVWGIAPHPNALAEETPGSFRRHEIRTFPKGMKPPSWVEVPGALADWAAVAPTLAGSQSPMEDLARAHVGFEQIHPFLDGNGRAGRLLANLLLVRAGLPPAVIFRRDRERYLTALRRADGGDVGALAELFARAVTASVYEFVLPAKAKPDQLLPLAALARKGLEVPALRAAIDRSRLQAVQEANGNWRSSVRWVDDYVKSRYERSPSPLGE